MGYQQGQRIGKAGTGLAEPLPLLLKQVRRAGACYMLPLLRSCCAGCCCYYDSM